MSHFVFLSIKFFCSSSILLISFIKNKINNYEVLYKTDVKLLLLQSTLLTITYTN